MFMVYKEFKFKRLSVIKLEEIGPECSSNTITHKHLSFKFFVFCIFFHFCVSVLFLKIGLYFLFIGSFLLPLSFRTNLCVGGTLDTGALREMRPRESALVAFLSSSYQPRNPVAAATRGCAGGLGGLSWVELPKDCRCRGNGRVRPCVSVCLSTLLIPHCAAQTRFDMGISRAHLTPETTVQLGSRHTARG